MEQLSQDLKTENPGAFSVLQSMVNYLFIINFNGDILLTSQSVLEETGLSSDELEGEHFKKYLVDKKKSYNLLESLLLSKPQENTELELKRHNGQFIPVQVLSTGLLKEFYNKEDLILLLCSDLRPLKKAQATLLQNNKMAGLGEMSSGLAHELNNPLTIMEGQLRRLKDYMNDDDITKSENIELIGKIQNNLGRAVKIIQSFRSISRKSDQDDFSDVSINELIDEVRELTQNRLKEHTINLSILNQGLDLTLPCRKSSLLQVFINLINNAVDAIATSTEKWIKIHVIEKKESIIFTIMDSGPGVELENQIRLFEPFFTTKDIGEGTGLGLSISRKILEDHGGSLSYTSKLKNSCFVMSLPRKKS